MNELIAELANHCDFYVGNENYDKAPEEKQRIWTEYFAKLLVRECIDVVELDDGATHVRELLTGHFGVE